MPAKLTEILSAAATTAARAAEPAPGLYEIQMQMSVPGLPMQMPVMSVRNCLKPEDVKSGKAYAPQDGQCKLSDLRHSGAKVAYRFQCAADGRTMVGEASGSSHAAGYEMRITGRFVPAAEGVSSFSQSIKARRIGA